MVNKIITTDHTLARHPTLIMKWILWGNWQRTVRLGMRWQDFLRTEQPYLVVTSI